MRLGHILDVVHEILHSSGKTRQRMVSNLFYRKLGRFQGEEQEALDRLYKLKVDYRRLNYSHRATEYEGGITLFVNEQRYAVDKDLGWGGVAKGGLDIHKVPGDHDTALQVHGKEFAEELLKCIDAAVPAPSRDPDRAQVGVS